MQHQSLVTRPKPEPYTAKFEAIHGVNGQELDPETIKCHICREYALSLSKKDISPVLGVSVKEGKYILYQKLHAGDPNNAAAKQSEPSDDDDSPNPTSLNGTDHEILSSSDTTTDDLPKKPTTLLTLPTEIRLMIYGYLFTGLTENTLSRKNTYPLPPLLRANPVFRHESLQEWGLHLERVIAQHQEVQGRAVVERKGLEQRERMMKILRSGNKIKLTALLQANEGQSQAMIKRIDKLRLLQAHHMIAETGKALPAGGSGERWRNGRV